MRIGGWLAWRRARETDDLNEELGAHLDMAMAERIARGESPHDAKLNARRDFGNPGLAQELARDQWSVVGRWIEQASQDARFAARTFRRAPAFTAITIATIALGIGASASIFSVVNSVLLRPLPYPHAEQLVRLEDDYLATGARDVGMSTPEWRDLQRSGAFSAISPTWFDNNNLTGQAHPERVGLLIVAPNYFSLLGVQPQLGSVFDRNDPTPGFNGQVVISDGLWKRAFGSDSTVLGRVVQLDSDSYRIVGVMPPGFQAPERASGARGTEVWPAMGFAGNPITTWAQRSPLFPGAIARVRDGLSIADAQRRVDALVETLRHQYPADYPATIDWRVRLVPLRDYILGDVRQPLLFLFGAVGLVLLIACTSVANLLLIRATARSRELAVRQAMGSGPSRLMRQLLTESVLLSLVGGALGVAIAYAARGSILHWVPDSVAQLNAVTMDWRVVLVAFGLSLVAGVLFGLAPMAQVRRLDLTNVLKQEGRATTGSGDQQRTRRALVVAEFAVSLTLMVAAALLVRSFRELLNAPLGFDPHGVTVVRTRLPYPNDSTEDLYPNAGAEAPLLREIIRRGSALGGVREVAVGSGAAVPLDHPEQDQAVLRLVLDRRASANNGDNTPVWTTASEVTPEYFHLLRIPLVRGRLFTSFDTDSSPLVAVVNESMARQYWPHVDAIGQRVKTSPRATQWTTIIGIVGDTRSDSVTAPRHPQIYASLYQRQGKHLAIFVRGQVETGAIERNLREQVQAINAALPVFGARSLDETVTASLSPRRFAMMMIAAFAAVALGLASLGIYGVVSFMVTERGQEIGVRVALGAQRSDVLRLVMRQGVEVALIGAGVGLVGALAAARVMAGILYGVRAWDPWTFTAVTAGLVSVAIVACYLPARRALRVDPLLAMRG
jgi:predicted permease